MKFILIVFTCIISSLSCCAHKVITIDELVGTKWKVSSTLSGSHIITIEFYRDKYITSDHYVNLNRTVCDTVSYYLESKKDCEFIKEKVGVNKRGSYIIADTHKYGYLLTLLIKKMDDDEMVLYHEVQGSIIIGRGAGDTTYKRIKSTNMPSNNISQDKE